MAKAAKHKKVEHKESSAKSASRDPFKTRKVKTESAPAGDAITPPREIAEAIDAFREAQDQAKHFEGEATIHKDTILGYSEKEYVKRLLNGKEDSFKMLGDETMVTYVVMDSSAGLTDEDVEEFSKNWGREAAEDLITRDFGSIRFDAKVLEANYDAVVEALQVLPPDVLDNLFKPMLMKARPGAAEGAMRYTKKPDDLLEMLKALRIKNYIR
jgi:hypothetical protein